MKKTTDFSRILASYLTAYLPSLRNVTRNTVSSHIGVALLGFIYPCQKARVCNAAIPYSSTPFEGGVFSVCAMHGLSRGGQAHVVALLSPVAGIPLAAAVKFSRSDNVWNRFVAINRVGGFDLSPSSP